MINPLSHFLRYCARNGRWILVASLGIGLLSETLALLIKPHIGVLIALLLFFACLRVGPKQAMGAAQDIARNLGFVAILQVLLPCGFALLMFVLDIQHPLVFALIMLWAAPSLSGSPHLVVLMGFDPAPALRLLVFGTALLPLTIIPVFLLLPEFGDIIAVAKASFRLLIVITIAAAIAFAIRLTILRSPSKEAIEQIDGASTLLLAIVVVGLMIAIRGEFFSNPFNLLITLVVAFLANIGMQIVTALLLGKSRASAYTVPVGLIAGNRNIALFLAALPPSVFEPLLLFIGCYQIPMYLTPIVMRGFYRRLTGTTDKV